MRGMRWPGESVATHVLGSGSRSAGSIRRHTTRLPPTPCAAHPDRFSSTRRSHAPDAMARRIGRDARARERVPLGRLHTAAHNSPPAHSLCRASRPILLHTQSPPPKPCAAARARRAKPGASAPPSPGEAWGRGGRITGGGGRVDLTKTSRRHSRSLPLTLALNASPKGEARRERAAKPRRSLGARREDYGWGWAGGLTKTSRRHSRPLALTLSWR